MKFTHFAAAAVLALASLTLSAPAQARGLVLYSSGDTITHVADLKDDSEVGSADIGWKHYQFSLFWMPLWSGEGSYVLYKELGDSKSYNDITEEQAMELAKASSVEASPPGFLTLWWGWLVILGAIAVIFWLGRGDNGDEAENA